MIEFLRLLISTLWKQMMGRWYVLRDAPLSFVVDIVESHKTAREQPDYDTINPTLIKYFKEADAELERRREQARRQGRLDEFDAEVEAQST